MKPEIREADMGRHLAERDRHRLGGEGLQSAFCRKPAGHGDGIDLVEGQPSDAQPIAVDLQRGLGGRLDAYEILVMHGGRRIEPPGKAETGLRLVAVRHQLQPREIHCFGRRSVRCGGRSRGRGARPVDGLVRRGPPLIDVSMGNGGEESECCRPQTEDDQRRNQNPPPRHQHPHLGARSFSGAGDHSRRV